MNPSAAATRTFFAAGAMMRHAVFRKFAVAGRILRRDLSDSLAMFSERHNCSVSSVILKISKSNSETSKLVEGVLLSLLPLPLPSIARSVKLNDVSMASFNLQSRFIEVFICSIALSKGEGGSRQLEDIVSDGDEDRYKRMCESKQGVTYSG